MVRNNNIGVYMDDVQIDKLLNSLDSIAQSLRTVEDTILELEFYNLLKAKIEGSPSRPPRKNEEVEASDNSSVSE